MPKKSSRIGKIPAFIKKLLAILDDPHWSHSVSWLPEQNGFHIINVTKFVEQVLPAYFKHQNMASFVRQLNMYGFSRTKNSEQHVYFHPKFKKGQINSIRSIKRKMLAKLKDRDSDSDDQYQYEAEEDCHAREAKWQQKLQEKWQDKYGQLVQDNKKLKRQNQQLKNKVKELQNFKRNMQHVFELNKQKMQAQKNQGENNTSTSNSDKSSSQPPIIKKEEIHIIGRSSFDFCRNPNDKNKLSYQNLLNNQTARRNG